MQHRLRTHDSKGQPREIFVNLDEQRALAFFSVYSKTRCVANFQLRLEDILYALQQGNQPVRMAKKKKPKGWRAFEWSAPWSS